MSIYKTTFQLNDNEVINISFNDETKNFEGSISYSNKKLKPKPEPEPESEPEIKQEVKIKNTNDKDLLI